MVIGTLMFSEQWFSGSVCRYDRLAAPMQATVTIVVLQLNVMIAVGKLPSAAACL